MDTGARNLLNDVILEIFRAIPAYSDCISWARVCRANWAIWTQYRAKIPLVESGDGRFFIKDIKISDGTFLGGVTIYGPDDYEISPFPTGVQRWKKCPDLMIWCLGIGFLYHYDEIVGGRVNYEIHYYCRNRPDLCGACCIFGPGYLSMVFGAVVLCEAVSPEIRKFVMSWAQKIKLGP